MSRKARQTLSVAITVVVLLAILAGSFVPESNPAGDAGYLSNWNVFHVPAYALLTAAALLALGLEQPGRTAVLGMAVVVSLLGAGVEVAQPMAGRDASLSDFLLNEVGVMVGIALFKGIIRFGEDG